MGTLKDAQRTLSILACIVLIGALLIVLFAPSAHAQKSAKQYHMKLQKEYSFDARMKENKSFTLASAKDNLRTARKNARKERKEDRKLAKVKAKREQIAAINNNQDEMGKR